MRIFLSPKGVAHAVADEAEITVTFGCGYVCSRYWLEREWLETPSGEVDCKSCRRDAPTLSQQD